MLQYSIMGRTSGQRNSQPLDTTYLLAFLPVYDPAAKEDRKRVRVLKILDDLRYFGLLKP